jgi:hypothetical protein
LDRSNKLLVCCTPDEVTLKPSLYGAKSRLLVFDCRLSWLFGELALRACRDLGEASLLEPSRLLTLILCRLPEVDGRTLVMNGLRGAATADLVCLKSTADCDIAVSGGAADQARIWLATQISK